MEEQPAKISPAEIRIETINDKHEVTVFTSYEQELVDFLIEDALDNQKQLLSVTFLWFYNNELVAYITLLNDKINLEGDLKELFKEKGIHYHSLPALKIGRLCVDDNFQRRGLGRLLVLLAVEKAKEINKDKAGCRFLTVDAKSDSVEFYRKIGFKIIEQRRGGTTAMYLDLLKCLLC